MSLKITWDRRKAVANLEKHGVSFNEAVEALADPLSLTIPDPSHSWGEQRFVSVGQTRSYRLVVVVHAENRDNLRIISARVATRAERRTYEEA